MTGAGYLMKRLFMAVLVLLSVTVLTFGASRLIPSDPAALFAGPRPTAEQLAQARETLGLDRPIAQQYIVFMGDALHGDFGLSLRTHQPILRDILQNLPATLELVIAAMLVAVAIGIPAGVVASARPGGAFDQITRVLAITAASFPAFWLAMLLQLLFFTKLGWLPLSGRLSNDVSLLSPITAITGFNTLDALITGNVSALRDSLLHLVLPAVTLGLYPLGLVMRMTRASMGEVMTERYITTARAMGIPSSQILFRNALKNALGPTLTVLGLTFAFSLTGAVLVEVIFDWPGLGMYVTNAILALDFPVIMAVTLLGTVVYVLINLAVDLVQAAIDPRISLNG